MQIAEDFDEIDYGEWTGRTLDELAEVEQWRLYNTFRAGSRIPGGELMVEAQTRSEEHTSELQSLMRISYAVFCLKKKNNKTTKVEAITRATMGETNTDREYET